MKLFPGYLFAIIVMFIGAPLIKAQDAHAIEGIWLREDKKNYKVEIYPSRDKFCGKIIWLKEPNDASGKPRLDHNNPDPKLRDQPLMGLDVLTGFTFEDGSWKDGEIYSFNRGKSYNATIKLKDDILHLTVSILFFSKTYTWIRSD